MSIRSFSPYFETQESYPRGHCPIVSLEYCHCCVSHATPRHVTSRHLPSRRVTLCQKIKMKILLGSEYISDEAEPDSEEASEGEQEDARDTFVDRTTVGRLVCGGWGSQEAGVQMVEGFQYRVVEREEKILSTQVFSSFASRTRAP